MNDPWLQFRIFASKRVHLGVTGSIAAYKALDLLRFLHNLDLRISATITQAGTRFVTPLSLKALGAEPVYESMFDPSFASFGHLDPQQADVLAVVPATANILGKMACGIGDDMLSSQILAFPGPVVAAPAMNPLMWANPVVQKNWKKLLDRGVHGVEPDSGKVACGDIGKGRLAPLSSITAYVLRALAPQDMSGVNVLVGLGPTREHWDAVRFWSNPSTGLMGACLAMAAWLRGANVQVVEGPVSIDLPFSIIRTKVATAAQMREAMLDHWPTADYCCMTAAVADFTPVPYGNSKFKKSDSKDGLTIEFKPTDDILAEMGSRKRPGQKLLGFAAETTDLEGEGRRKLESKNLDLLAANPVREPESGFVSPTNRVTVIDRTGRVESWPVLPKTEVAWRLWDHLLEI